jgi:hypothetical protein
VTEPSRAEKLHDEYRRKIWEDTKSGTENFDKYMLTFSSGALALSLAFIKDVVPIGKAIWIPSLISSWIAFVLCILVTLISFRISIRALEKMGPCVDAFYLEGKTEAFNKHLESFWTKAVDWCAYFAISFFILGLTFTMMFVGANIREAKRVSKDEIIQKTVTGELGKGLKPAAMTPLNEGVRPVAMTPVVTGEHRGLQPVPMTPAPTQAPAQPASSNTPSQPAQSPKE